jgi:hypothetical protein
MAKEAAEIAFLCDKTDYRASNLTILTSQERKSNTTPFWDYMIMY